MMIEVFFQMPKPEIVATTLKSRGVDDAHQGQIRGAAEQKQFIIMNCAATLYSTTLSLFMLCA